MSKSVSESDRNLATYHVSREGQSLGPWSVDVIAQKLSTGDIAITDFVWDNVTSDWTPLLEFSELKTHLQNLKPPSSKNLKPSAPPRPTAMVSPNVAPVVAPVVASMSDDDAIQWYVTRGAQKFGPFNYFGVVKALQDKSIFEFDYVWKEGMEAWVRLAEHEKFAADSIRELLKSLEEKKVHGEVFAQRRHARLALENDVIINDNQSVSSGRMVEASAGGSGLVIKNATLIPGQLIHVHFSSLEGLPAFNALGEIVSKKFIRSARDPRAPIQYGVRFVKMDPAAEERVKNYFKIRAEQASA